MAVLIWACPARGVLDDKIFTSSGQILPGEEWDIVNIYNDDTVVDMLGGSADWIATHDGSTLNVSDGSAEVAGFDYSSINISGGSLSGAEATNYATVEFYGNGISTFLAASDFGTATMTGGVVGWVGAADGGTLNLHGGLISDSLSASGSAVVNIYAYDFRYEPGAGNLDGGQITGVWFNGSGFTIDLYGAGTYARINVVPEPCALLLLGVGALLVRRRRC